MEIALVYPHQLFEPHPALGVGREVWLVEDPLFFGNDPRWPSVPHRQKLMLHRASMKAYGEDLAGRGWRVNYVETPEGSAADSADLLDAVLPRKVRVVHVADVADDVLMRRVRRFAARRGVVLEWHETPAFLSPPGFLERHTGEGVRKPFMARFYESQRKRMGVLLESDGSPVGGSWSFDADNRARLPARHVPPPEPIAPQNRFTREAAVYVERRFPGNPGDRLPLCWPATRSDAEAWLDRFFA